MVMCCAALLFGAGAARAHAPSDAYLNWQVDGARVEQRADVALRDLDRELALDADGDGEIRWGEVRTRWVEIERWLDEGLALRADGQRCIVQRRSDPALVTHGDGQHVVLQSTLECARPVRELVVDYRLFQSSDPTHRGIARLVTTGGAEQPAVLVPGGPPQHWRVDAGGSGTGVRGFGGFVAEGLHHIAIGADHLLFLVTLLMVAVWRRDGGRWVPRERAASAWKEAFRLVTAFTVAHSITLGMAAAGVFAPPSVAVETLIAASVLLAAIDNLWRVLPGPRWTAVAGFGLVHGFGFAGPLQALGLRQGDLALPLLGFNLGVELGQLLLVALLLPLAVACRAHRFYAQAVVRLGSAGIAAVALLWTFERGLEATPWR